MGMHRIVLIVSYYGSLTSISEFKSSLESPKKITIYFIHPFPIDLSEEILENTEDTDERYKFLSIFKDLIGTLREVHFQVDEIHPLVYSLTLEYSKDLFAETSPSRVVAKVDPRVMEDSRLSRELLDLYLLDSLIKHLNTSLEVCLSSKECPPKLASIKVSFSNHARCF